MQSSYGDQMNVCMLAYAHYINDARIKNYVRSLEQEGCRVDILALRADGEAAVEERPNGTIFRILDKYQGQSQLRYAWSYIAFLLKSASILLQRSFRQPYDVIHVHNMPNFLVFAALIPKILGSRVMLDVHDLMPVNYMAKFGVGDGSVAVTVLKIEQWISAKVAEQVFCADHNQQDYLAEHCWIPPQKISVLLNLPNPDLFKLCQPKKRAQEGVFRIIYHGTIAHRLGIDLILRAVAKVGDRIPVEIWIYGAGDYLPDALALSSQLAIERKVHFSKAFFPVEQIPEFVCGMDLGIIGNRRNLACDRYMLPVKLLEYVYLGVPVVAPRLSIISRYFDNSMIRFYEPENVEEMAQAIVELYQNSRRRGELADAALQFYQNHNPQKQAKVYLGIMNPHSADHYVGSLDRV